MSAPTEFVEPYPGWAQENKGPLILGVTGTLTAITLFFVAGRIYSRMISLGRLGIDDYIVILCIVGGSSSGQLASDQFTLTSPLCSF
jgi:hypothetical protein